MKKEYRIIGLDCAHCALTLEKYLQKVDGVSDCNINFTASKMFIEVDDKDARQILKNVMQTTKQVNPDVKLLEEDDEHNHGVKIYDIILYVIGLILGCIHIFVNCPVVVSIILLVLSILALGYRTYVKAILQLRIFKINENTLVTISVIGAILIGEAHEAIMVIALYTLGKMLEARAVNYSRKSISALINSQPEYAMLLKNGKEEKVKPEEVNIGEIIVVRPGEKIPLDGIVVDGKATIDNRHLTGESEPISIQKKSEVYAGSVVLDSVINIKVTKLYKDSTVTKILDMVGNASNKKSKTETIISKFASIYTLIVIILSVITFGLTAIVLKDINVAIYRGLIFLVVSCPCAFAISVPLGYFSGIGICSKHGILVKGSNYLDAISKVDTFVFDKTGTLTTGDFQVVDIKLIDSKISQEQLLQMIVAGEEKSNHPISKAICAYYGKKSSINISDYKELSGVGIEYKIANDKIFVGKSERIDNNTSIIVKKNNKLVAKILLSDTIKPQSQSLIEYLRSNNIETIMLTGDNEGVAKNVADRVGVDQYKSRLLPQDKYAIIEDIKSEGKVISFVGDGLNDAPALNLADVGISMGILGTDATIESSDIVIADDKLEKIKDLIAIAKKTKKIVIENIVFACVVKITFLVLGAFGITGMLHAVFADVGVTLIAIFNSLRVLRYNKKK